MTCRGRQIKERNDHDRGGPIARFTKDAEAASVMSNRDPIRYRDTEWVPYAMGAVELPQSVHQQSRT